MAAAVAVAAPMAVLPVQKTILLEEGRSSIQKAITRISNLVEGRPEIEIGEEEFKELFLISISMITQKEPHNYSEQLYDMYHNSIKEYTISEVLPPLREKHDEFFLMELLQRWSNHKKMVQCLSYMFLYLEVSFISQLGLDPLKETGLAYFKDLVYQENKRQIKNAMIALIDKKSEGEQINRDLLTNVLNIFVENRLDQMVCHDFADFFLKVTTDFYVKAKNWIHLADYMMEGDGYLKREEERVGHCLHISSNEHKLLEGVLNVLFSQLIVEESSNCFTLLHDVRAENLSRIYGLFKNFNCLTKLSNMFKTHLMKEFEDMVRQADNPASCKKIVLQNIFDLHDKHAAQVKRCFQGDILFRKAFRDGVSESLTAKFFVALCEHIAKKGRSEKLSDDAIQYALKEAAESLKNATDNGHLAESYRKELSRALLSFNLREVLLPSLRKKHGEVLLMELVEWWSNRDHMVQVLVGTLSSFLDPLDQYISDYMHKGFQTSLEEIGFMCFRDSIYQGIKGQAKDDVIALIGKHREGQKINTPTLRKVMYMFHDIEPDCYMDDIVVPLLDNSKDYYSKKAQSWLSERPDYYMIKVNKCLMQEREQIGHYLPFNIEHKLLEEMQNIFLAQYSDALLHANKDQDLFSLCILSSEICSGLEPIVDTFKTHLKNDVMKLVKAKYPASNLEDIGRKIIRLHDRYEPLVTKCFQDHASCSEALQKEFKLIFTDGVLATSGTQILTTLCDSILKKGFSGNLNEGDLAKVVRLLAYISDKVPFVEFCRELFARRDFVHLFAAKCEVLSSMYQFFYEISCCQKPFIGWFKKHLANEIAFVKQEKDSARNKEDFVSKIIGMHDKYEARVSECFMRHSPFLKALREAFGDVCNVHLSGISGAELLATFCDNILQKGCSQNLSDEAIEDLDKAVRLVEYLSDKDLFAKFCWKKLARRLLSNINNANEENEKIFLEKLKKQLVRQFTSKMEGMVADVASEKDNKTKFQDFVLSKPESKPGIAFGATVLTAGLWPKYRTSDLKLPAEMEKCVASFREFYQTETRGRKLTWIYSLGTCNIIAKFETKPIELNVTTWQAALLLLFNECDRLNYSEIVKELNLPENVAAVLLHSLSGGKYKILNKVPSYVTISPTDVFEFNSKFTSTVKVIKIPLPPVDVKKDILKDVDKERKYQIDASIVRIMKSRKVMSHEKLVAECVEQLSRMSFKPDISAIKKRIDDLITREYLERDKAKKNIYNYLA